MAETGVVDRPAGTEKPGGNSPAAKGDFFKKNKKLVIGGGLLAGFLVMSHKGANSGSTGADLQAQSNQLQQQSDLVAAEQAALQSGFTGVGAPAAFDSGLGAGNSSDGTSGTDATQGDNSTTKAPEGTPSPQQAQGNSGPTTDITVNIPPSGAPVPPGKGKGGKKQKNTHKNKVANPHHNGSHGHGTTVHGRTFPGGRSHTIHGSTRQPNGDVHTRVTVNHGGHTTHHISVNGGKKWIDHPRGSGPPSRNNHTHEVPGGESHTPKPIPSHRVPSTRRAPRPTPVPHRGKKR